MCSNPVLIRIKGKLKDYDRYIPCGHCMSCRVDKLLLWQARCNSEYIKFRSSFLTFTYDNNHIEYNTGALYPTLRKEHFTKYIDNLRHKLKNSIPLKNCNHDFKYFGCGEYGETGTLRSHYHILFFGLDFNDYRPLFTNTWKRGFITSLPLLAGGVRYVCDYVTKQKTGNYAVKEYDMLNRERPFISVSQGLGSDFFLAHKDEISTSGNVTIGSRTIPVPSYYVNLCTEFSLDNISKRYEKYRISYADSLRRMKNAGFDDYDKYLEYSRRAKENALVSKARRDGVACDSPVFDLRGNYSTLSDLYKLIKE